ENLRRDILFCQKGFGVAAEPAYDLRIQAQDVRANQCRLDAGILVITVEKLCSASHFALPDALFRRHFLSGTSFAKNRCAPLRRESSALCRQKSRYCPTGRIG